MINVWKVFAKLLFWADLYLFKQRWYIMYAYNRNLLYYGSGYDWSFFTISQPLHNRLPPQWKPFIFEQIAQSSHNSQHEDISLSPGYPGTDAILLIRRQALLPLHYQNWQCNGDKLADNLSPHIGDRGSHLSWLWPTWW